MIAFEPIVFETALGSIFDQLPAVTDANGATLPVRFDWGTKETLDQFITLPESRSKYPLIWLVTGKDSGEYPKNTLTRKTRLIIATNSDTKGKPSEFTYQTSFKVILDPILANVFMALERSGITLYDKFEVQRMPNYSVNKKDNVTVDIWNAIVLDIDITIRGDRKLRQIKF